MNENQFTELQKLTDSIVRGERTILFAPGLWSVIAVILLLVVSSVTVSAGLISICCINADAPEKAAFQGLGMGMILVGVILPGLLLFRGVKLARSISLGYSLILVIVSVVGILMADDNKSTQPFYLSLLAAAVAFFLVRSSFYIVCSEFYYLLQSKRRDSNSGG